MIRDRVQQISTTSGTGPLDLDGGAVDGNRAFAGADYNNNDPLIYCVLDGLSWEVIEGVFLTGAPPKLTRVRTLASSNGGSPVSFTGGNKQVFNGIPAELMGALQGRLKGADSSNVADAFAVALPVKVPLLVDWMDLSVRMKAAPAGPVTLEVGDSAAKPLRRGHDIPIVADDWAIDDVLKIRHDAGLDHHIWENAPEKFGVKTIATNTYTVLASDGGRLLRFTHASGCAVALDQVTSSNALRRPWHVDFLAVGGALVFTPTTSQIDGAASLTVAKNTSGEIRTEGTNYFTRSASSSMLEVPVRQCVLSSVVDANGFPNYIAAGSGLAVDINAAPTPLILTAANGCDANGAVDRVGIQSADTSLVMTASTTNYIYGDIAADGTITFGKTSVAPADQRGGTYSITNGQFTFNIVEMVGKVGNGSVATQTYRVYIGEAVTNGSGVTSVVHYALQGRYQSSFTATLPSPSTAVAFNHNLGWSNILGRPQLIARCTTIDASYAVNDLLYDLQTNDSVSYDRPFTFVLTSAKAMQMATGNGAARAVPKGGGAIVGLTLASWSYAVNLSRGW